MKTKKKKKQQKGVKRAKKVLARKGVGTLCNGGGFGKSSAVRTKEAREKACKRHRYTDPDTRKALPYCIYCLAPKPKAVSNG